MNSETNSWTGSYVLQVLVRISGNSAEANKRGSETSAAMLRRRWKVERLFAWIKRYRRIASRWKYKAANYLAFIHLACIVIVLRRL